LEYVGTRDELAIVPDLSHDSLKLENLGPRDKLTAISDLSHLEGGLSRPSWAIFYNAYIPQNGTGRVNALRVIAEQMGQIGNSTVLKTIRTPT
jgi:hypothetical protein